MIQLVNVTKQFNGRAAVSDLSIDIQTGQTLCLIGTSGCGKTTTMKMVNRLLEPTSGSILVDGQPTLGSDVISLRRRMGYVTQKGGLFPHMTVEQNVGLLPRLEGWDEARVVSRVKTLLELVNLPPDDYRHRYPGELSGGQQQRVGVARGLALDPPILLMDEPFGALDPITRRQIQEEFMRLKGDLGKTIILVTHDLQEAFRLGDLIALMDGGKLVQVGQADDFLHRPATDFAKLFVESQVAWKRAVLVAWIWMALASAVWCLTLGSKKMPESEVLADLGSILVQEKTGMDVDQRLGLGGTMICFEALKSGSLDVYPEYTGSGLQILQEGSAGDSEATYQHVKTAFDSRWKLLWLKPIGFNNTYALAMPEDKAAALGIRTVSDLARHQDLHFASSNEFLNREDGWIGLARTYGFTNAANVMGMEHGLLYEAVTEGKVDVIDVYSTDAEIRAYHLRVLEDDKHFFPPYDACFVVREDALQKAPGLQAALETLSGQVDNAEMQQLNYEVKQEGKSVHSVAVDFLVRKHLIAARATEAVSRGGNFFEVMWNRRSVTMHLVGQHMGLTAAAVALACLLAIPLGIAIAPYQRVSEVVLGVVGVIQTVPSIALLAFMIPFLGLGVKPTVAALFLYALLPIVRNTYTGIVTVDATLVEAAQGLGLGKWQIMRLVELPLAMPMIMAGIRTSTVICIGTATLAAFIGAGGLGEPIVTGLSLNDHNLILAGAVPAAMLAVGVDLLLGVVEKWVAPRGTRRA